VDKNIQCTKFLAGQSKEFGFYQVNTVKQDVFRFLEECKAKFDLIFADPPYDLENIPQIHRLIFENSLLNQGGTLIIEHGAKTDLQALTGFTKQRKYGNVNFSFFEKVGSL
jgi:16S rRNA G966 N2-methylase RsmD